MLVFRQLIDQKSSTFTYLLGDSNWGERLLIDSVKEKCGRDLKLIEELGLRLTLVTCGSNTGAGFSMTG